MGLHHSEYHSMYLYSFFAKKAVFIMFLFLSGFPCAAGVQFRARDVKKHTLGLEKYIIRFFSN